MRFAVTYEDGTTDIVEPGPADVIALEAERKATLGQLIRSGSPQWSYFLTWHKLKRRGEVKTFDAWLDNVTVLKDAVVEPESEDADPTVGAPASPESAPPAS